MTRLPENRFKVFFDLESMDYRLRSANPEYSAKIPIDWPTFPDRPRVKDFGTKKMIVPSEPING